MPPCWLNSDSVCNLWPWTHSVGIWMKSRAKKKQEENKARLQNGNWQVFCGCKNLSNIKALLLIILSDNLWLIFWNGQHHQYRSTLFPVCLIHIKYIIYQWNIVIYMNWKADLLDKLQKYLIFLQLLNRIGFFPGCLRQWKGQWKVNITSKSTWRTLLIGEDSYGLVRGSFILVFVISHRQLTISSCSCLCRVELSFSCCLLYICMISTTILSLSSSIPPTAAAMLLMVEPVSLAATSVTSDNNDAGGGGGGGGGVWAGMWVAFLQLRLLVSMETAWVWHSRSVAEAASARWDLASSAPAETGGDAWRSEEGGRRDWGNELYKKKKNKKK